MNIGELYGRLASGPREEALTLGVTGHDERANRARAELADAPWPKWARQALETLRERLEPLLPNSEFTPEYDDAADQVALVTREGDGLIATFATEFYGYRISGKDSSEFIESLDEAVAELQQAWRAEPGHLTVFTKDHCPACQMTRRQFDKAGLPYMVVDLAEAESERAGFVDRGIRQAPVVEVAGQEPYGGFNPARIKDIVATFPPIDEAGPTAVRAGGGHRPPRAAQHDQAQARGRGR